MGNPINLAITYEDLLAQKLAGIDGGLDKREGSIVFNATAANSAETIQMLDTIKNNEDLIYADTAPRENLIKRAAERGRAPLPATKAKRKGVFNIDVPIGSRFSLDEQNYIALEKTALGEFVLQCEIAGNVGNLFSGQLIPIEYIEGLTSAQLTDVLVPGEDEEDTEAFRLRYFNSFESVAYGGNRADYKEKVNALSGIGGVRMYRAKYGPGTVGLTIINSLYEKPTTTLVGEVQETIDPLTAQGEGVGIAPMDHIVTVDAVTETTIDVTLTITYQSGWAWADIETSVQTVIDAYFKELAEEWAKAVSYADDNTGLVVRISQIETRLLGVNGVLDIANTLLNSAASNVSLDKEAIPKRGVVIG